MWDNSVWTDHSRARLCFDTSERISLGGEGGDWVGLALHPSANDSLRRVDVGTRADPSTRVGEVAILEVFLL